VIGSTTAAGARGATTHARTPGSAPSTVSRCKYGGTVLKSSLSKQQEKTLQDALHGETVKA
jgi:hypothetical protein